MSKFKGTPGPWMVCTGRYEVDVAGCGGESGGHILRYNASYVDKDNGFNWTEAIANARLIAAAPELLELAEAVVGAADWNCGDVAEVELAKELITRIEVETP